MKQMDSMFTSLFMLSTNAVSENILRFSKQNLNLLLMFMFVFSLKTFSNFKNVYVILLLATAVVSSSVRPYGAHQAPLSMGFSREEYWSGLPCLPPGYRPHPRIEPRSPALSESPGKPKNTGVGSLFLLQGIFPTQELNWCLLNCRQCFTSLSYQGSLCNA